MKHRLVTGCNTAASEWPTSFSEDVNKMKKMKMLSDEESDEFAYVIHDACMLTFFYLLNFLPPATYPDKLAKS